MSQTTQDSIRAEVRQFLVDSFFFGKELDGLTDGDSLLDKGIIDSTGILEVITFLEDAYGISIHDDELVPANLDSIGNVAAYVLRKQSES